MKKTERIGEEKIRKLLLEFSLPATIGMLVNALYNIVDRIYIGNSPDLGTLGLAGISISFPITLTLMAIALMFGVGGATLFSIKLGEKRPDQAEHYLGNAVFMLITSSIIFTILSLLFLTPLLRIFGASDLVAPFAIEYMKIVLWGSAFQALSMGLNHFIRADGNPKVAMISMFLGAGFNIIFDPIFIYGFRWGMKGAALATIGGQLLTTIWVVSYFIGKKSNHKIRAINLIPKYNSVRLIISTGLPSFLRQIANSLLGIVLNKSLILYGGDIAVSGMAAVNSLQTFILMPIFGITQGAQPIIGYNFGAKKMARVSETLYLAIGMATIIATVGWLMTRLFPVALIAMFGKDSQFLAFGANAIGTWFLFLPVVGFQILGASYFQATGRPKISTILTASRQLIFLIPLIIILPSKLGVTGILLAAPIADLLSFILTGFWLWLDRKRLSSKHIELI